jgi:hypothetical protein
MRWFCQWKIPKWDSWLIVATVIHMWQYVFVLWNPCVYYYQQNIVFYHNSIGIDITPVTHCWITFCYLSMHMREQGYAIGSVVLACHKITPRWCHKTLLPPPLFPHKNYRDPIVNLEHPFCWVMSSDRLHVYHFAKCGASMPVGHKLSCGRRTWIWGPETKWSSEKGTMW